MKKLLFLFTLILFVGCASAQEHISEIDMTTSDSLRIGNDTHYIVIKISADSLLKIRDSIYGNKYYGDTAWVKRKGFDTTKNRTLLGDYKFNGSGKHVSFGTATSLTLPETSNNFVRDIWLDSNRIHVKSSAGDLLLMALGDSTNKYITPKALSNAIPNWAKSETPPVVNWDAIEDKPYEFTPASHGNEAHSATYITSSALSGYATQSWTNSQGFLKSYSETDPTIYSWAKASTKPTYTYSEVGAAASSHNHSGVYQPAWSGAYTGDIDFYDQQGHEHILTFSNGILTSYSFVP